MEQLAKALRAEMERRGHSYREAAATMGVASGTVVNWSKGWVEKAPRVQHWPALAAYIGVPMFVILGWLDLLTDEQIELVQAIPGYLNPADLLAVSAAQTRGYLKRSRGKALVAAIAS